MTKSKKKTQLISLFWKISCTNWCRNAMQIIRISIYISSLFLFIHFKILHGTRTSAKLRNWKVSSIHYARVHKKKDAICGLSIIIMLTLPFVAINACYNCSMITSCRRSNFAQVGFSVAFYNINTAIWFYLNLLYKQTNIRKKSRESEHCLNK